MREPFDGRHEQAVDCFDQVVRIDPGHFAAWFYRGNALKKLAHQAQVRNRTAHLTRAEKLPFEDRVRQAAASFDRAASIRPDDPQPREAKTQLFEGLFGADQADWPDF